MDSMKQALCETYNKIAGSRHLLLASWWMGFGWGNNEKKPNCHRLL